MNELKNVKNVLLSSVPATPFQIRQKICRMEFEMLKAESQGNLERTEFPLRHQFAPGLYIRTIFLPKTTLVIGSIHKYEHFGYISKGHVTVLTEQDGLQELKGYWSGTSPVGVKRAIYVHEDTFWTTIHVTDEKDPVVIRKQVIVESYTELGWDDPMEELKKLEFA